MMAPPPRRGSGECAVPPLEIEVQAIQLSPYRAGLAGHHPTRLPMAPASPTCSCPLRLSPSGKSDDPEASLRTSPDCIRDSAPRPAAHTFASYGSRQRDIMGKVHFASSTVPSPWTALRVRWIPVYCCPTRSLRALPKPRCRHLDSATKPDMNVSVHPAPQQRGVCHTYLGNQSLWLFSYRDNVDATVASCRSHPSLRPFWVGCDRLPSCLHP